MGSLSVLMSIQALYKRVPVFKHGFHQTVNFDYWYLKQNSTTGLKNQKEPLSETKMYKIHFGAIVKTLT